MVLINANFGGWPFWLKNTLYILNLIDGTEMTRYRKQNKLIEHMNKHKQNNRNYGYENEIFFNGIISIRQYNVK